jgi:hypothetical protein
VKATVPRYRWWLLVACLALLVVGLLCWPRTRGRFTREQYDRIRLGMTPAEVLLALDNSARTTPFLVTPNNDWDTVAEDGSGLPSPVVSGNFGWVWRDESVQIWVYYHDAKTVQKRMYTHVPSWKVKAREWLAWLRGLVGV